MSWPLEPEASAQTTAPGKEGKILRTGAVSIHMDPSIDQGLQVSKDERGKAQNPHRSRGRLRATWILGLVLLMGLIALQTPVFQQFLEKGLNFEPGKSRIASLRILLLLTVDVVVVFAWLVWRRADMKLLLVCVGALCGTWIFSVHIAVILSAVLHQFR